MWGQTFHTLTPTLQTLTHVPLGFLKPLLNTTSWLKQQPSQVHQLGSAQLWLEPAKSQSHGNTTPMREVGHYFTILYDSRLEWEDGGNAG